MSKTVRTLLTVVAALTLAGCYEFIYVSGAPDGTLAFCQNGYLFVVRSDLKEVTLVRKGIVKAEYSPDGTKLLCVFENPGEGVYGVTVAICGTDLAVEQTLETLSAPTTESDVDKSRAELIMAPRWSPDGRYVSYFICPPFQPEGADEWLRLAIRSVDGRFHRVIDKSVAMGYSWSPDSGRIAYFAASRSAGEDVTLGRLEIWDVEKDDLIAWPLSVLFTPFLQVSWTGNDALVFTAYDARFPVASPKEGGDSQAELRLYGMRIQGDSAEFAPLPGLPPLSQTLDEGYGCFAVSGDAKRIAFYVYRRGASHSQLGPSDFDLYLGSLDGREPLSLLAPNALPVFGLRWVAGDRLVLAGREMWLVRGPDGTMTDMSELLEAAVKEWEASKQKAAAPGIESTSSDLQSTDAR